MTGSTTRADFSGGSSTCTCPAPGDAAGKPQPDLELGSEGGSSHEQSTASTKSASGTVAPVVASTSFTRAPASPAPPANAMRPAQAAPAGGHAAPKPYLWNGKYYYPVAPAGDIDVRNLQLMRGRIVKAVLKHVQNEDHHADFAVTKVTLRQVSRTKDRDLLKLNPVAMYISDVSGRNGRGKSRTIRSVANRNGSVDVDPRIRF